MILVELKNLNFLLNIGLTVTVVMGIQDGHCQSTASLTQCEIFCKQYNLPLHFSLKKKHCCCRNDSESSEPGYAVIREEGDSGLNEKTKFVAKNEHSTKKLKFSITVSSLNVTISRGDSGFGHIY